MKQKEVASRVKFPIKTIRRLQQERSQLMCNSERGNQDHVDIENLTISQ